MAQHTDAPADGPVFGAMLASGRAYSNGERVNVIYATGDPDNLAGNHHYARARGPVVEYVRECVADTMKHVLPGWMARYPSWTVTARADYGERGRYEWTVWERLD
ncbi:hypothetical protein SEA_APIARY_95 [Rhodococcus phage Apiary]|nr:hypothetical protein SEA_MASELOP_95 [Rhodococcus phage Maselop]WNM69903.1 hypothetical protein SEA_APIARY_95 [Rhodococcus phage Apiary]